jgi:hypothetical protein
MATNRFLTLVNNVRTLVTAISASVGAGDAFKIIATNAAGVIDPTLLPPGIGANTKLIEASEALAAGEYVNVHDVSGARVRLANATDATKPADGFVLDNVASGAMATVYFDTINSARSGLTPGVKYVLSKTVPGGVTALSAFTPAAGNIIQQLGTAISATEIETSIQSYDVFS